MLAWAAANGVRHQLALALRIDLIVSAPVNLEVLPMHGMTFAHWCCKFLRGFKLEAACATSRLPGALAPLGRHQAVLAPCTVTKFTKYADAAGWRSKTVLARRTDAVDRRYFVMDWWVAGPPELIASWGLISANWSEYTHRNDDLGIGNRWAHFIFAQHVHDVLRAPVHFSSALCTMLARRYFDAIRQYTYQQEMKRSGLSLAAPTRVHLEKAEVRRVYLRGGRWLGGGR